MRLVDASGTEEDELTQMYHNLERQRAAWDSVPAARREAACVEVTLYINVQHAAKEEDPMLVAAGVVKDVRALLSQHPRVTKTDGPCVVLQSMALSDA